MKMQSGNVEHRIALTRTTQQKGQHDHQQKAESSRQEHQVGGIDGKSLMALLAVNSRLTAKILVSFG